jgi:hypothetical protein
LLVRTHTPEASEFLLENIDVKVPLLFMQNVTTQLYPCEFAVFAQAGWEIIPATLKYLKTQHDKNELRMVAASVWNHNAGNRAFLALLEVEYARPANDVHMRNLRVVMDYMIGSMGDGELTPEQRERRKLLVDGKIEYGQITDDEAAPGNNPPHPAENNTPPADGGTAPAESGTTTPPTDGATPPASDTGGNP